MKADIWNVNLRKMSTSLTCLAGNSSISDILFLRQTKSPCILVKMQINLGSEIPKLQFLLHFHSSNTSKLVNSAGPRKTDTGVDRQDGKDLGNRRLGPPMH